MKEHSNFILDVLSLLRIDHKIQNNILIIYYICFKPNQHENPNY